MGLSYSTVFLEEPPIELEATQVQSNQAFSEVWAKKYLQKLNQQDAAVEDQRNSKSFAKTAKHLMQSLRSTSAQAWTETEKLLSHEIVRHKVDSRLIDPWAIAKDTHDIYETALSTYARQTDPAKLSSLISADLGQIRQKHTAEDPRVIGFISMQFHFSGQMLLNLAPKTQQKELNAYFKVIDDHLYMPLQRAYWAAAKLDHDSPRLRAVQQLLPLCTEIATRIVSRVIRSYPSYQCHTGQLSDTAVQTSSIRDAEMFQVYLWVCVLENNVSAVQQELFPLCVMLYPKLKVRWELVRQLIHLLGVEIRANLDPEQAAFFAPYHESLWAMFSPQVFPE